MVLFIKSSFVSTSDIQYFSIETKSENNLINLITNKL